MIFHSFEFDLYLVTMVLKLDLEMVKIYLDVEKGHFNLQWFKSCSLNRLRETHTIYIDILY